MRRFTLITTAALVVFTFGCGDHPVEPEASHGGVAFGQAEQASAPGGRGHDHAADAATKGYEVTVENLTESQPFSPGVIVTHTKAATVWSPGDAPSPLIVNIAETGLGDPELSAAQIEALRATEGVFRVVPTGGPIDDRTPQSAPLPNPPSMRTFEIEAAANANRLSVAVMIICSNDGFTGVHGVELPGGFGTSRTFYAVAYDAGSEANTEEYADIVDPCQVIGPAQLAPPMIPGEDLGNDDDLPEDGGIIAVHPGVAGGADLGTEHDAIGWGEGNAPVARIHIRRTRWSPSASVVWSRLPGFPYLAQGSSTPGASTTDTEEPARSRM